METTFNKCWCVTKNQALDWAFTGVMLRGSGFSWDLRLVEAYDSYNFFDFSIPVGQFGDVMTVI